LLLHFFPQNSFCLKKRKKEEATSSWHGKGKLAAGLAGVVAAAGRRSSQSPVRAPAVKACTGIVELAGSDRIGDRRSEVPCDPCVHKQKTKKRLSEPEVLSDRVL